MMQAADAALPGDENEDEMAESAAPDMKPENISATY
jgi:hypothetical protein